MFSLRYNGSNCLLFVNATKNILIQNKRFRSKSIYTDIDYVKVIFQIILQLIAWKKTRLEQSVKAFCVDYNGIDTSNILDIYR